MSELSKSKEVLAKEEEIKALRKKLKKRKTVLKSLNTRLSNTQEEIQDFSREMQLAGMKIVDRMEQLKAELKATFREAQKAKLSKKVKNALSKLEAEVMKGSEPDNDFEDFFDEPEEGNAGYYDHTGETEEEFAERITIQDETNEEDKEDLRNIRKVYLRLSQQFHPDRADSEAESQRRHDLMLRINTAYKNNDIHTLLEIEREYGQATTEDILKQDAVSFDALEAEIKRLEHELQLIENQVSRTSGEIKELRQSEQGQMLTEVDRFKREGGDLTEAMFSDIEEAIETFEEIQEAVRRTIKKKKLDPLIEEFLTPNPLEQMLAEAFGVEMPSPEPAPTNKPQQKPAFSVGQLVQLNDEIALPQPSPFLNPEDSVVLEQPFLKVIEKPSWDGEHWVYRLHPDKTEIEKLSKAAFYEDYNFTLRADEVILKPTEKSSETTWQEDMKFARSRYHQYAWENYPELGEILRSIFLHPKSEGDETQDWLRFFHNHIKLPIDTKRLRYQNESSDHIYPVLEIYWSEDHRDFRALVQGPKRKQHLYLYELYLPEPDEELGDWLKAYQLWRLGLLPRERV